MSVFTDLEHDVEGIFNGAVKEWNKLDVSVQNITKKASSILAIISQAATSATGQLVLAAVQKYDPSITEAGLVSIIQKANNTVNTVEQIMDGSTLEQALTIFQTYLNGLPDNIWIIITKAIVSILIDFFMPGLTIIQRIELCVEYVYQKFIRPELAILLPGIAA